MSPGGSSSSDSGWFIWWVLVREATDPLSRLPQCLLRSRISTIQGSVLYLFISSVCVQGYLGHSKLVYFSCLWACLSPCIYRTWYHRGKDHSPSEWSVHMGQIMTSVDPPNLPSIPWHVYICRQTNISFCMTVLSMHEFPCMYVHMYKCIHIWCMHIDRFAFRQTYMHEYRHACFHVKCINICRQTCMDVCVYGYIYVCIYICISICMHACMNVCG